MKTADLFTEVMRQLDAAKERQDQLQERYSLAYGFYRGELPAVMQTGDIAARRVMWEAFESLYPSLVAIFTDSQKAPVNLDSDAFQNSKIAIAITRAVHGSALKIDDYYRKTMLAIKEILITGNQAGLVGYDTKTYQSEKHTFQDAPASQLAAALKVIQMTGYNVESEIDFGGTEDAPTVTGWIQGRREIKFPVINLIAFKDFYLHPKATDTASARYCAYAEEISVAEALKRGYKKAAAEAAENVDTNAGRNLDTSMMVVGDMNAQGNQYNSKSSLGDDNDLITVYHHFWRGCYNSKQEKLYHVITTSTEYLEHEEVSYCPLIWGAMAVNPDSAYGESLYDYCKSTQESSTRARRAIQRSADFVAYPDMEVVDSLLTHDAKAALNDRSQPGRIYKVKQAGAIKRIATNDVPQAMQILNQEIDQDVQNVKQGSAGQAQALEKNTNVSGTAIALTQNKQELNENQIAKCIAETWVKPMYRILILVLQEMGNQVDIEGVQVPFKAIRNDIGLSIDVETEYDRAQAATSVFNAYTTLVQLQRLPKNIQGDDEYHIVADYFRAATGQEDVSRYITPTKDIPQPPEWQQKIQAVLAACQLRSQIAETQLAESKVNNMDGDTQKKYNEAAKCLADIKSILGELDIDKIRVVLEAQKQQSDAADELTKNAIEQEKVGVAA
ncbi:portal protein [Lelliottia nimipressuralis]|uniref:Portal protein n=1 Tax=Lelliottia nimipressuralis TaxID=69220 RepID=A0ABD4KEH8_9ENTR|nr:hypothetical protein [Lelliottia nimipressuralis]MBF4178899.1 hypothetical protein [Lelliottia nimipressuralis]